MATTRAALAALTVLALAALASATVYFEEDFRGDWQSKWAVSDWKKSDGTAGKFAVVRGKWYGDEAERGLQTSQDARFYAISAPLDTEFDTTGKSLVFQFTVKHEQRLDCGGGYFKLLYPGYDAATFNGDTPYAVMFGPDICGTSTRKTHVIWNADGENHLVKREVRTETDQLSHLYTLVVRPDNSYLVKIDGKTVQEGSLEEDFGILPPRQIADPDSHKPADWVDEKEIADETDVKPADWDSVPATIVDPDAEKPDDWNDDEDGEWEPRMIPNPEYKGVWKQRKIPNPAYKGEWKAPMIDNPEFAPRPDLYAKQVSGVGLELWQVKAGSIFSNVLVTDDEAYAEAHAARVWGATHDAEAAMFNKVEEERRAAEEKAREESRKAEEARRAAQADDDDDDDDADDAADDDDDDADDEHDDEF